MSKVKGTGLVVQQQQQQGASEGGYGLKVNQRKRRKRPNEVEEPPFYIPT